MTTNEPESAEIVPAAGGLPAALTSRAAEVAIQAGPDGIQALERIFALHEREQANLARQAFHDAMARFHAECPPIAKRGWVKEGRTKAGAMFGGYGHARLVDIAATVNPILARLGLSYRWGSAQSDGRALTIACIVSHIDGHSEESSATVPLDESGNKSATHSAGSTMTYAQRYSLIAALGLTTCDPDDDAAPAAAKEPAQRISAEDVQRIEDRKEHLGVDHGKFLDHFKVGDVEELTVDQLPAVHAMLDKKERFLAAQQEAEQ